MDSKERHNSLESFAMIDKQQLGRGVTSRTFVDLFSNSSMTLTGFAAGEHSDFFFCFSVKENKEEHSLRL